MANTCLPFWGRCLPHTPGHKGPTARTACTANERAGLVCLDVRERSKYSRFMPSGLIVLGKICNHFFSEVGVGTKYYRGCPLSGTEFLLNLTSLGCLWIRKWDTLWRVVGCGGWGGFRTTTPKNLFNLSKEVGLSQECRLDPLLSVYNKWLKIKQMKRLAHSVKPTVNVSKPWLTCILES